MKDKLLTNEASADTSAKVFAIPSLLQQVGLKIPKETIPQKLLKQRKHMHKIKLKSDRT